MKYFGSKSRIAKDIVPIIQNCIDRNNISVYYEPFVGGANVIDKIKCDKRIGNDINPYLIALFRHLQNGGELLDSVSREEYSKIRSEYISGNYEKWYVGNVGFLASYNGRWFDGGYAQLGYEKTAKGCRYRDYYQESKRNLLKQVPDIINVEFECHDYRDSFNYKNAVIYCDPPYQNTKQFQNSYDFNYDDFWDTMRKWSRDNYVFISELSAPDDFECIYQHETLRSIKAIDKRYVTEKLFIYKGE